MEFNLGQVFTAVADAVPQRDCVVQGPLRRSYGEVAERSNRLANVLLEHGLSIRAERGDLVGHESGQDHLGCYLHNGTEYLEAMLGSYTARVAPFNVNYRYVAEELLYLLDDAGPRPSSTTPSSRRRWPRCSATSPPLPVLLQVADDSGQPLLPGAVDYEAALAGSSPEPAGHRAVARRSLHPLHRRHDRHAQGRALAPGRHLRRRPGRPRPGHRRGVADAGGHRRRGATAAAPAPLPAPPFMHGAAHWLAFNAVRRRQHRRASHDDPSTSTRPTSGAPSSARRSASCCIVGDAFARPLSDELDRATYDARAR